MNLFDLLWIIFILFIHYSSLACLRPVLMTNRSLNKDLSYLSCCFCRIFCNLSYYTHIKIGNKL